MTEYAENYRELAAAIVKLACADYVDARIIAEYGYLSKADKKAMLMNAITYGEKRYCYYDKRTKEIKRGSEKANRRRLETLKRNMPEARKKQAKADAKEIERFFDTEWFEMLMPNTDKRWLLDTLRKRAHKRKRIKTDYERGE